MEPNTLYKKGLYVASLVGEIKQISKKEILKIYNELPIHDKMEINIEPLEICEYLNIEPSYVLHHILDDIENQIINKKFKNEKEIIKKYLNKYKK